VNRLSVDDLFQRYMQTGFLYRDKLQRLAPFTSEIMENWRRAAASPDNLLRVVTYSGAHERSWASLATWRHTESAWCCQHLVSLGDPFASRAVLLAETEATIEEPRHLSNQNWFRPDNRLPRRVFGSIIERLGPDSACANNLTLFEMPLHAAPSGRDLVVSPVVAENQSELSELAGAARGRVYAIAEGLTDPDFELRGIDQLYRRAGLFRYRRAWLAHQRGELVAALVAFRGPLGLNYSFIENRAELFVSSSCSPGSTPHVTRALLSAASECYRDFKPGHIPLFVDERSARPLGAAGHRPIRRYCQTIYLRSAYARYHTHLQSTFARVAERAERQRRRREALVHRAPEST
jgi:hypothetical protein